MVSGLVASTDCHSRDVGERPVLEVVQDAVSNPLLNPAQFRQTSKGVATLSAFMGTRTTLCVQESKDGTQLLYCRRAGNNNT